MGEYQISYLWPNNVFAAMNKDPAFLFHFFFRKYHTIMFDAAKEVYRRRHAPDELKNGNRRETSADRRIGIAD